MNAHKRVHIGSRGLQGPVEYQISQPLLPALDIQGYGVHFYRIFLSVYGR